MAEISIKGKVILKDTKDPASGATVKIEDSTGKTLGTLSQRTATDGTFSIKLNTATTKPGFISITTTGYQPIKQSLSQITSNTNIGTVELVSLSLKPINQVENTASRSYTTDPRTSVTSTLSPIPQIPQNLVEDRKIKARNRDCKGLECLIKTISEWLGRVESEIDDIYFGNPLKKSGIRIPGSTAKVNGIYPIVEEISKVDLCNILNYVTNNVSFQRDIFGEKSEVSAKIQELKERSKKLADFIDTSQLSPRSIVDSDRLKQMYGDVVNIATLLDDNVIAAVPQLASTKNFIDDVSATLNKYTVESMFSGDVQKVLGRIRGLQTAVMSIQSIDTPQDIINLVQSASGINLNRQLTDLQKKINPAELLPAFKQISRVLRGFNQIALKVVNYVKILELTEKAQQFLLKVVTVIEQVLTYIPIPLFPVIASVTQVLQSALQRIKTFLEKIQKIVSQIARLVDIIYSFILGLIGKITELDRLVQTIIFNLETCKATATSPVLEDLKDATDKLADVQSKLDAIVANYRKAQEDTGKKVYNGFTFEIVEEELVDEEIRNKRRKAIALDGRGILVAETPLTFATDRELLYEELKFILSTKGLTSGGGISTANEGLQSEDVLNVDDIYESIGFENEQELKDVGKEVSAEISNFIKGIKKGGRGIKKKIQKSLTKYATKAAQDIRTAASTGTLPGVASSSISVVSKSTNQVNVSTGDRVAQRKLTEEERLKWEGVLRNPTTSPALKQRARTILEADKSSKP